MSFITNAAPATTVANFVKSAEQTPGVKYIAEKNATHTIYVPFREQQVVTENGTETVKEMIGYTGKVHEWNMGDKYHSTICLENVRLSDPQGNVINDGTCPICGRVSDAWDVYKQRIALAQANSPTGQIADSDKRTILDERKAKDAVSYVYMLIAQFKTTQTGDPVINQTTNLPDFAIKVMKLSPGRIQKIEKALSATTGEIVGSELMFVYPNVDDKRALVSGCVTTGLFPGAPKSIISKYPAVVDAINEAITNFSWVGIEKSFSEWKGMSVGQAETLMNTQFKQYDDWKKALATDPNAKYLEYTGTPIANTTPAIAAQSTPTPNAVFAEHTGVSLETV